jgi:hypothetical protein
MPDIWASKSLVPSEHAGEDMRKKRSGGGGRRYWPQAGMNKRVVPQSNKHFWNIFHPIRRVSTPEGVSDAMQIRFLC